MNKELINRVKALEAISPDPVIVIAVDNKGVEHTCTVDELMAHNTIVEHPTPSGKMVTGPEWCFKKVKSGNNIDEIHRILDNICTG